MQTNKELHGYLSITQGFENPRVEEAFQFVDRSDFVLPKYKDVAYQDAALSIGFGATISQPSVVLFMLNRLGPEPGQKILDVGSGSGWTSALLARTVGEKGKVFAVELMPELVEQSINNLSKYKFKNLSVQQAGKGLGLETEAPFDRILVSAAANQLPEELVSQLKVGGRMLIPIKNSVWQIDRIAADRVMSIEFEGFAFVPLI